MDARIASGGETLAAHIARPMASAAQRRFPALVLAHGFPHGAHGAATAANTYPELADRLAADVGWLCVAFNHRGTGESTGDFSLQGWLDDLRAVVDHVAAMDDVSGVWLAGSGVGGALALVLAGDDERVRGVATLAAPADFDSWAADPKAFLEHCRHVGVVRHSAFPPDAVAWARELREIRPLAAVARIPPRPLLLLQGDRDDVVSTWDARALVDAAGGEAELRIVNGAGHRLRDDPRAIAILLGWLERQRP